VSTKHPTTPPPELVGQWQDESPETQIADHIQYLVTRAAQWGADQELEAVEEANTRTKEALRNESSRGKKIDRTKGVCPKMSFGHCSTRNCLERSRSKC